MDAKEARRLMIQIHSRLDMIDCQIGEYNKHLVQEIRGLLEYFIADYEDLDDEI